MALSFQITEFVGNPSPSKMGFILRQGGRAELECKIRRLSPQNQIWRDLIPALLGDAVRANDGTGRIKRTLPIAHPDCGWLYASSIPNIVGDGRPDKGIVPNELVAPAFPAFAVYPMYRLTLEFQGLPYPVLPDSQIDHGVQLDWHEANGEEQSTPIAEEWYRYCWWDMRPSYEVLQAKVGAIVFRAGNGGLPDGQLAPGTIALPVPSSVVRFNWAMVPLSYVYTPNAPIRKYLGRVNQFEFLGWPPGYLRYEGVSVTPYLRQIPDAFTSGGKFLFEQDRLCDIEFVFSLVERDPPAGKEPNDDQMQRGNPNIIPRGHNTAFFLGDRQAYYVTTTGPDPKTTSEWRPLFASFPFELLFQDPIHLSEL